VVKSGKEDVEWHKRSDIKGVGGIVAAIRDRCDVWWHKDQYKLEENVGILKAKIIEMAKKVKEEGGIQPITDLSNKYNTFLDDVVKRKYPMGWGILTSNETVASSREEFLTKNKLDIDSIVSGIRGRFSWGWSDRSRSDVDKTTGTPVVAVDT